MSSLSDGELFAFARIFCRGGHQRRPDGTWWRRAARFPSPEHLRRHFECADLYGQHVELVGSQWLSRLVAIDLDRLGKGDAEAQRQATPLDERLRKTIAILGEPDFLTTTPGKGLHVYYFLPEDREMRALRDLVSANLRQGGLVLRDGLVEVYPSKKVIRFPFGGGMAQLDPKTMRPVRGSLGEQVRRLVAVSNTLRVSKILELSPLEPEEVAVKVASERLKVDVAVLRLEDFKGSDVARLIASEGSNLTKMALIRCAWNAGILGEEGIVGSVMDAFRHHGSGIPSRFTDDPEDFEQDVRFAVRNWLHKAGRVQEGVGILSRQDVEWLLAVGAEVQARSAPGKRRSLRLERYLSQVLIWARAHGATVPGGVEFDLPSKIELAWEVVGHDDLAVLRSQVFVSVEERERRHAVAEAKHADGGRRRGQRLVVVAGKGRGSAKIASSRVPVLQEVRRHHHSSTTPTESSVRRVLLRYVPVGPLVCASVEEGIADLSPWPELRPSFTRASLRDLKEAKDQRSLRYKGGRGEKGTLSIDPTFDTSSATPTFYAGGPSILTIDGVRSMEQPPSPPKAQWIELLDGAFNHAARRQFFQRYGSFRGRFRVPPQELRPPSPVPREVVAMLAAAPVADDLRRALLDLAMHIRANRVPSHIEGIIEAKTPVPAPYVELRRDTVARFRGLSRNKVSAFMTACWNLSVREDGERPLLEPALNFSNAVGSGPRRLTRGRIYRFDPRFIEGEVDLLDVGAARERMDELLEEAHLVRERKRTASQSDPLASILGKSRFRRPKDLRCA